MPGSIGASSAEQPKAKVTDSSVTNGIFVRPVAVAGIFRPAEESANKPPALPEKRRFSALVGDLRPCSTGGGVSNDFVQRRQSWDTKTKDISFGQALLRKTPRNTNASPLPVKQELTTNGSSHEDISLNDKSSLPVSQESDLLKSNASSESTFVNTSLNVSCSAKDGSASNDISKKEKSQIVTQSAKESVNQSYEKNQNTISAETISNVKSASDSYVITTNRISSSGKSISKAVNANSITVDKSFNSTDISKQSKKVYGLAKRDSKCETSSKTENSLIQRECKSEIDTSKNESLLKKELPEIPSKPDFFSEKLAVNISDSSKNKNKVYGLNKTTVKKDIAKGSETKILSKQAETIVNKQPETIVNKQPENIVNKRSETLVNKVNETVVTKLPESNVVNKRPEVVVNKGHETVVIKKPEVNIVNKRSETVVNKGHETVAIKQQGINAVNKQSEANIINKRPEANVVDKQPQDNIVNKQPEANIVSKQSKTNFVNKPGEFHAVNKKPEPKTANKQPETKVVIQSEVYPVNKHVETDVVSKHAESNASKLSETDIISNSLVGAVNKSSEAKEIVSPKFDPKVVETPKIVGKVNEFQKAESPPKDFRSVRRTSNIIADKVSEFQKAESPPKDFRTVRRTSNVIAAKIQNIFSNISTPEKPPPVFLKKIKSIEKTDVSKQTEVIKLDETQITKLNNENQPDTCDKIKTNLPVESKFSDAELSKSSKLLHNRSSIPEQEVKISTKLPNADVKKEECKYKQQSQTAADQSGLKKENKLASESNSALQSHKVGEVLTACEVKTEPPLGKADSKTKHSINAVPSKAQDKKILNTGGKMPIKKEDVNSLEGTASLKAANQDDRKSLDSTAPLKTVMENANKGPILKTESNICAGSGEKISKTVSTSCSLNTSVTSSVNFKNNYNVKKVEKSISVKESDVSKSGFVSTTTFNSSTIQLTDAKNTSCSGDVSHINIIEQNSVVNGKIEGIQVSKIEVAKITPSTVPGIVPTINVLFRTKSPQNSSTKEENRKKVVVETYTSNSPVPYAVINASKLPEQQTSSASESIKETLKAVKDVQKSLNSPSLPKKHLIINLKKEELATVTLASADASNADIKMPPNIVKAEDKCSVADSNIETPPISIEQTKISETALRKTNEFLATPSNIKNVDVQIGETELLSYKTDRKTEFNEKFKTNESFITEIKPTVVDLGDWNKKFQRMEPEPPRVPLRRRALRDSMSSSFSLRDSMTSSLSLRDSMSSSPLRDSLPPSFSLRDSMSSSLSLRDSMPSSLSLRDSMPSSSPLKDTLPPSLPNRSRFGSLKRIDDSPRYLPRSPSQSSLPQRYSYTEMLSKVCSMGVLPFVEPSMSKSCSSSSSQVSELWSELGEEQSTATHTSEMLESETTERMRLEKEVQELQNRCSQVQLRSDKMEMEMMEARVFRTPELNGDLSEDDDPEGNSSLYKQKYERAVRDMEIMKRRIQQQHEEEMEQKAMFKKASDKRLAEALEDVEEERQVANQWKRKAQKLGSELQDLRLMLEEQMARNGELEKKQRRFDAELSAAQEEIKKERLLREKFSREKDQALHEKYSLEQDLQSTKLDADTLHEKISQLNRELDELTLSSKGEEEVTQLKRAKQELERKSRDQEEELEELAAQVGMLEQAKLRLEMSLEKVRQEHRREASVREEEIEEIRASFSKKIKNLEAQLESEQDERHQLVKQKHELERKLYEIADQPSPQDPEIERRLRRDLKRTKALLRDAQSMLEHTRDGQSGKTLIRQLKNQLEDSEFAKAAAVKARQAVESELLDCQTQLEEATRAKNEAETRCLQLSREKSAIQTQLEEAEEEMAEVMKKYKAVVAQMSIDQKTLSEQNQQIADLETEKQMLKDQLSEVSHRFEHLSGQSEDTHKVHRLDGKVRDLESKLELEQTTRSRLEHQIARLKEQNDRAREECDSLRNKELQAQEGVRRLQRQIRDLREDYSALQQKEAEAYRKQHELEMAMENTETDLQVTKNDLRLACQRIQDLQNALEDDLDSGTDVPDSGSDSDDSFELAALRNSSMTPTMRCDSAASNYSFASEGIRSRTSSFTQELSAFSRMMLRRTSMDFLG